MRNLMFARVILAAVLGLAFPVLAQDYPSRPIRIIVPNPPGGASSILGRVLGDKLKDRFGQPVIIENRSGAGANIGAEAVYRAAPDGYTLLFTTPGPLAINKMLYAKLAYDPDAFVPISVVAMSPTVLIAGANVPAETLQQLIAYARANPGRLSYASPGSGSTGHLTAEMLKSMAGVDIVHVPYKGIVPARTDLLAGQVDIMFSEVGGALPLIQAGKVRALAIGSEKRDASLPEVPTLSEVLPGFVSAPWFGLVAPPATPTAIASQLSAAIAEALKQPDVLQRVQSLSLEAVGSTPAQMDQFLKKEREFWGTAIRVSGARVD
jgi:tripartite-type tricarboxylate transporter receptor subunit TctC